MIKRILALAALATLGLSLTAPPAYAYDADHGETANESRERDVHERAQKEREGRSAGEIAADKAEDAAKKLAVKQAAKEAAKAVGKGALGGPIGIAIDLMWPTSTDPNADKPPNR